MRLMALTKRPQEFVKDIPNGMVYAFGSKGEITVADSQRKHLAEFHKLILSLEKRRKSRIFSIVQCGGERGEDEICGFTFREVYKRRMEFQHVPMLELLLDSPGGSADVAYALVRFLRRRCTRLNVIVPYYAKSAATLMALGADAIYMGEFADLGPIDAQMRDPLKHGDKQISPLDELKSAEFLRDYALELVDSYTLLLLKRSSMSVMEAVKISVSYATGIMRPLYEQINPLEIGEHRRLLAIGEEYAKRLLDLTKNPRQKEIVAALVSKYPSHSFVIDADEAREIGLPVHRLAARDEHMFLEALNCIRDNEDSFHGFSKVESQKPPVQSKQKSGTRKKPPASTPKPAAVELAK